MVSKKREKGFLITAEKKKDVIFIAAWID